MQIAPFPVKQRAHKFLEQTGIRGNAATGSQIGSVQGSKLQTCPLATTGYGA